jgi:hypothetical protein
MIFEKDARFKMRGNCSPGLLPERLQCRIQDPWDFASFLHRASSVSLASRILYPPTAQAFGLSRSGDVDSLDLHLES